MLGLLHLFDVENSQAHLHFDLAEAGGANLVSVLNNLALLTLYHKKFSAEDALLLVDSAIKRAPDQPYCRETRGRILVVLGRYQEAIEDLKKALVIDSLQPIIYQNLAKSFRELGDNSGALQYEKLLASQTPATLSVN